MKKRKGNHGKTILVVDDEPEIVEILTFVLSEVGYTIIAAYDGDEALEKYKIVKPDLVLTNYVMPGMNGLELLQQIRQKDTSTPIVMLTCHDSIELAIEAFENGLDDFMAKPFRVEELKSKIEAAFRRNSNERQEYRFFVIASKLAESIDFLRKYMEEKISTVEKALK